MSREGHGHTSWGARFLAPVVFLVAVTIAVLIVRAGLSVDDDNAPPPATALETRATTIAPRPRTTTERTVTTPPRAREFYEIEAGDTLETIAADRGTTVERLLTLNPGLDPIALRIGQRIRVE
ncbi:MAG: LysM peptidoglycan-binding domain-containing protein [Gaiellaceae bacterium MAG52_C11]|nr:LysM peptidoglycan-binding domain-containing protein [Candidatus Gaiellasilicea maunaloa]